MKRNNSIELLVENFLQKASVLNADYELIKVLKARTYKIAEANVLIRAASAPSSRDRYFFGINYIHVEELANLDNPFIAFICGHLDNTLILPAQILFDNLKELFPQNLIVVLALSFQDLI